MTQRPCMRAPMPSRPVFVVDASMYGSVYAEPREVYSDLDRVVRTDLLYHYSTPICAQRWLDVCQDPAYGHLTLLGAVRDLMPEVAAAVRATSDGTGIELISLGPGDGSVDECMLQGLGEALELVSYTALDFSFELLRCCVHRISTAPKVPAGLPLLAVCADFTDPIALGLPPPRPGVARVFALTGLTLGNYREDALLNNIREFMGSGDYLFLDARLHELGTVDERSLAQSRRTYAPYETGTVRRFVLGPVEVATTASVEDLHVCFELTRALSRIPNALNLVIYCSGLDATMRLTGERVQRRRLDLAVTTSYHLPELERWFDNSGFTRVWQRNCGDAGFFLLKR